MSASPRHSARHRAPRRRRFTALNLGAPAAAAVTVSVVAVGVAVSGSSSVTATDATRLAASSVEGSSTPTPAAARTTDATIVATEVIEKRKKTLSRSLGRRTEAEAVNTAVARWTTTNLNLWSSSAKSAEQVGELEMATKVRATGRSDNGRDEVVVDGTARWVTAGYLAKTKPDPIVLTAPCADSSVERGMKASTIKVYRSVCAAFPEVTEYGGWAGRVEHNTGNALDVMVYGDKALGDRIAAWVHQNAAEFNLYDIIWYQRIWTPVRASEGWRMMENRGSATANHYDHVHIGTN